MAILLTMPSLSPTMESGVITTWNRKVGDFIDVGEVIAEIETDKAVMEFEMPDEGYVRALLVEPGVEVSVGTPIAILAESMDEDIAAVQAQAAAGGGAAPSAQGAAAPSAGDGGAQPAAPQPAAAAPAAPAAAAGTQAVAAAPPPPQAAPPPPQSAPQPAPAAPAGRGNGGSNGHRVRISPYARKLAREANLDVATLQGSGPGGRIVAKDVESARSAGGAGAPAAGAPAAAPYVPPPLPAAGGPAYEDVPLNQMRKAIARKMAESKTTVPHFQLTRKIRAEGLLDGRERLKAQFPELKITVNDVIVKACAAALRQHPTVNSQFLGDSVRRFNTVDVAVAVGTEDGLITPVVRNADLKGLAQISAELKALAAKARERKLTPEDYSGGTFTVSNLGMYGVTEFNAIINTPQACILAVSGVVTEPVVEGDALAVGRTLNMTLSSDHRVVDGVVAAQFMDTLARMLENPLAILL